MERRERENACLEESSKRMPATHLWAGCAHHNQVCGSSFFNNGVLQPRSGKKQILKQGQVLRVVTIQCSRFCRWEELRKPNLFGRKEESYLDAALAEQDFSLVLLLLLLHSVFIWRWFWIRAETPCSSRKSLAVPNHSETSVFILHTQKWSLTFSAV